MTLIKSISGIRGTIGGAANDNLTPLDTVKFASAYGMWLKGKYPQEHIKVVIGRDARPSGEMVQSLVQYTLIGLGINVIDLSLSTTPTVEMAVKMEQAQGGIIITASHNPKQWNALKLLNEKGEFVSSKDGEEILHIAQNELFDYAKVDDLGTITANDAYFDIHIDEILALDLINPEQIAQKNYKIVVDAVNSTGAIAIPKLLEELGVQHIVKIHCTPNGQFPHNPEPLKEHLGDICQKVVEEKADLGIVVDPDVDRLVFISENGEMFGEEYTLVACADYVLGKRKGNVVSNLSSTRALSDVAKKYGVAYAAAAVGEVNVVEKMKETQAIIGGEGNGGVILPELHYGRDAMVGVALFLSLMAERGTKASALRQTYTAYFMSKNKIELTPQIDTDALLKKMQERYQNEHISTIDGLKIDFPESWVHLRKSNTEPIIRIYTEANSQEKADELAQKILHELSQIAGF